MNFRFTISNLGTFLGKSPVTIRNWERKGMITLPRVGNSRSLNLDELKNVATVAYDSGRISSDRLMHINETIVLLQGLEKE